MLASQIPQANSFTLRDGSVGGVTSPASESAADLVLVWPENAVGLTISAAKAVKLRKSTDFPLVSGTYYPIPGKAGDVTTIIRPVACVVDFIFDLCE